MATAMQDLNEIQKRKKQAGPSVLFPPKPLPIPGNAIPPAPVAAAAAPAYRTPAEGVAMGQLNDAMNPYGMQSSVLRPTPPASAANPAYPRNVAYGPGVSPIPIMDSTGGLTAAQSAAVPKNFWGGRHTNEIGDPVGRDIVPAKPASIFEPSITPETLGTLGPTRRLFGMADLIDPNAVGKLPASPAPTPATPPATSSLKSSQPAPLENIGTVQSRAVAQAWADQVNKAQTNANMRPVLTADGWKIVAGNEAPTGPTFTQTPQGGILRNGQPFTPTGNNTPASSGANITGADRMTPQEQSALRMNLGNAISDLRTPQGQAAAKYAMAKTPAEKAAVADYDPLKVNTAAFSSLRARNAAENKARAKRDADLAEQKQREQAAKDQAGGTDEESSVLRRARHGDRGALEYLKTRSEIDERGSLSRYREAQTRNAEERGGQPQFLDVGGNKKLYWSGKEWRQIKQDDKRKLEFKTETITDKNTGKQERITVAYDTETGQPVSQAIDPAAAMAAYNKSLTADRRGTANSLLHGNNPYPPEIMEQLDSLWQQANPSIPIDQAPHRGGQQAQGQATSPAATGNQPNMGKVQETRARLRAALEADQNGPRSAEIKAAIAKLNKNELTIR